MVGHQGETKATRDDATSRPFLKWTGGKRWLIPKIRSVLPEPFGRYIEPFLGGGALFFYMRPWPASLSDLNEELINTYVQVRDNVERIITRLSRLKISSEVFDGMRDAWLQDPLSRAVRMIYLNRTAFNGIYRVNRQGSFNVPFGCKPGTILCDEALLRSASFALRNRRLRVCNCEEAINEAKPTDLVYADPPYTTKHNNNGFRRYNEVLFSWKDQERLANSLRAAAEKGVNVVVSSPDHAPLTQLYEGFSVKWVTRPSLISGPVTGRGRVTECLIYKVRNAK